MSSATLYLHFLGGSARAFDNVAAKLEPEISNYALDLPGFGNAADESGAGVAQMADGVAARIRGLKQKRLWIVGHSLGAKVALAVARRAEDGMDGLPLLAGIVLLAGSPPAPEPMDEEKRSDMLSWIGQADDVRRAKAREFIAENVGSPLAPEVEQRAVEDVLSANPSAWKRWLTDGAREDWRQTIGVLKTPSLIVSGSKDAALGPHAQARLMAPHLADHRDIVLNGAGHLLPLERPEAISALLNETIDRT